MHVIAPWSMLLWSGVPSAPAPVPAEASVSGSLRLMLSLEPKRTCAPERELMSGDASDSPGRSSALVGVTVNRTDAIVAHLEREESGRREPAKSDEGRGNVKDEWSRAASYVVLGWGPTLGFVLLMLHISIEAKWLAATKHIVLK